MKAVLLQDTPGGHIGGVRAGQHPGTGMTAAYFGHQHGDQRGADAPADLRRVADCIVDPDLPIACADGFSVRG